jgi:hypothetical protein
MLWNVLDRPARLRLVRGLRDFFSQPLDNGAREQVIPDGEANTVLTRYCRLPFARGFLLYRLYGNASAFSSAGRAR